MCSCGSGGPNLFETFDGKILHFSGKCQYQISSYTDPRGTCSFSVDLVNKRKDETHLTVKIVEMNIKLLQNQHVQINGQDRSLPAGNSKFIIYKAGFAIRLFVPSCGFLISWDGDTNLLISVPVAFSSGLDGICGNCNQNKKDDPTTADVFSKYTVTELSRSTCENAFSTTRCNRRSKLMMKMRVCKYQDRAIKRRCNLSFQESKTLMRACIDSGCDFMTKRKNKAAIKTGCQTLDLFSGICRSKGHDVNWRIFPLNDCRRPRCKSSANMETNFGKGISGCPQTCGFAFEGNCTLPLAEGCKCKDGFVWDGDNCVRPNKCGCTTPDGDYISVGKSLISEHCSHVYKCVRKNGKATLHTQPGPCVNKNCVVVNGEPKCTSCKEGFEKTPDGCIPKFTTTSAMQTPASIPLQDIP
ncbi:zonadhesin-like [Saccostrea echinata]|uniref:zonadhesin-like n=1 Tax=Saccostrea echinata TaxID=191078 RepID=UPI002A81B273|nr:zonadhesin-like [Saccostrea echinata]